MKRKTLPQYSMMISLLLITAMLAGSLQISRIDVQAAGGMESKTAEADMQESKTAGADMQESKTAETDMQESAMAGADMQESKTAEEDSRFQHPGLLHTQSGFDKMKENVENNVSPVKETWDSLCGNTYSNAGWLPRPLESVIRGGNGDNINQLRIDIRRAYQNALIWKINGDEAHGEAASRIINAWSSNMKQLSGNADRFLAAGLQGYELANIGEMMRDYPGFDTEGLQSLLLNVFYPMNDDFMIRHNDAYIGNYWANWELANLASMISIGVYCDREDIYERALNYFKTGKGNGSFYHTMPYVLNDNGVELVQWQESVRDQGHATLGMVLCGVICETAWNQGDDLYCLSDNRFMKAAEYMIKYNSLNQDVPSADYEYRKGQNGASQWLYGVSSNARGNWRPVYYLVYNHYVNRRGLEMPCMEQMMKNTEGTYIEGVAGNSLDELGWYSLTYAGLNTRMEDEPVEGDLSDGVYRILSASSGKSLVVNEEGNLASAEKGTRQDEWWLVKNTGDGEYTLTNLKTGKLMQINGNDYYSYGTQIGTGEFDGSRAQRFAFLSESDGSFRIVPSLNYLVLALENNSTEDSAKIVQWRNDAVGVYWNSNNLAQRWKAEKATEAVTEFTFDDETEGFRTEYASLKGEHTLQAHGDGKAVSLDGSRQFLTAETTTGKSIVAGEASFTVSFEIKPEAGKENWIFYAAPNGENQEQNTADYLGVKEENGIITVERCRQGQVSVAVSGNKILDGWHHISVVFDKKETVVYVDGKKAAAASCNYLISDILNDNGILQIGKANLENGRYFHGLIDNVKITGHAMTEGEALAQAADYVEGSSLPEILAEFTFDDETSGFSGGAAVAKGAHSLKEHDDGNALYLDGWRDFLKVTKPDGSSIVSGGLLKKMTVSFQVKPENETGWVFYAAKSALSPVYNEEQYIGILDSNGTVTAQRFKNRGQRLASAETTSRADSWHHLAIVFTETEIAIYDNGEEKARVSNDTPLYQILGGDGIWQIGKANWGSGEYFKGQIDNYKVVSRAWTEGEVKAEAVKYVDKSILQESVDSQWAKEEGTYSEERWKSYQESLKKAKDVLQDGSAIQPEVDAASDNLNNVQSWMRLDEAIAESIEDSREAEYTKKSWNVYHTALVTAKEMQALGTASREKVNEAAQTLFDAQKALFKKNETIQKAIAMIDAIGNVQLTPDCSRNVILARQICDAFSEEELSEVTNLNLLVEAEKAMSDYLLEFTFDDEETGLIGGQAVAQGTYTIKKATGVLYLDGKSNWLKVTKGNGDSLLTGREELTVSFAASPVSGNSNWCFFAAPNADAQVFNNETYLGIMELEGTVTSERYKNAGERAQAVSVSNVDTDGWIYVTLVCKAGESILYINGEEKARVESGVALPDIFGENGILQIGKANWNEGEYYAGYLDNYKILGRAMTAEEIKDEAKAYLANAVDVGTIEKEEAIRQITDKIGEAEAIEQEKYTEESFACLQEAIEKAKEAAKKTDDEEGMKAAVNELQQAIDNLKEKPSDGDGSGNGSGSGDGTGSGNGNGSGSGNGNGDGSGNGTGNESGTGSGAGNENNAKKLESVTMIKAVQQSARRYVTVSFLAVSEAASYDIYRSTKAKSGYQKIGTSVGTSYVDKKASAAKTYYYKVIAVSKTAGCSSALSSEYAKVKVLAVPTIKLKMEEGRKVKVSWKKVKGANGYEIYTSAKKTKGFKKIKTLKKGNKVKAVVTAKKNAKKLYVKVRPYYLENGRKITGTYSKVRVVIVR